MDAVNGSADHPPLVAPSRCEICGKDATNQVATNLENRGGPLAWHRVCQDHTLWFFSPFSDAVRGSEKLEAQSK